MNAHQRFERAIEKDPASGCWIWLQSKDPSGYGHFFDGRFFRAHRWSYVHFIGPIPVDQYVCHRCDNPSCVNPEHLFLGSADDNHKDAVSKGRLVLKLDAQRVVEIRHLRSLGVPRKRVAQMYGVSVGTVEDIELRLSWKWVGE